MPNGKRQQGMILLGVLVAIAIVALVMAQAEMRLSTVIQREREKQLLFAGDQIKQAIKAYYNGGREGGVYPKTLGDLVNDTRTLEPRHFLRRIYLDPMTDSPDWGLIKSPDERIVGVYSQGTKKPLKQAGFPKGYEDFAGKKKYRDWEFVLEGASRVATPGQGSNRNASDSLSTAPGGRPIPHP